MHQKSKIIILSAVFGCFTFGCSIVEDFIADKVEEKVAEEVTEEVAETVIEKAIEKDGGGEADVDLSSGKVNVKTKDGSFSMATNDEAVKIPENFPKDVTIPGEIKVIMAIESGPTINIAGETQTPAADIFKKAAKDAVANGWTQKTKMDMGQMRVAAYEKDGRNLTVSVGAKSKDATQKGVNFFQLVYKGKEK